MFFYAVFSQCFTACCICWQSIGKSAKDDVNGDDEANLASSGAGKSVFFDEDFVSVVGDKEDEDYDPYSMEQEFSPLQDDQFVDILETSFAEDFFPMSFLQKSRGTENRLLGVVHLPPRRPLFFRKFSCKYTAVLPTDCCQPTQSCYFDCCNCHPEYNMHLKSEQEFLDGSRSLEFVDWLENRSVISNQLADIENQQAMISQPLGVQTADHLIDNGVFDIRAPTMARILLRGEPIAGNIASITAPDLDLARVTQRLLQEAKVALVRDEVRRKWFQSGNSKLGTQEVPPSAKLLKYLGTAPMLNIIENPADDSEKQILLPTTTVQYGGKLGDWSADASEEERFGAIPPSFENKKSGKALFRVHVHKLVLSQHHLMSEEERGVLQLKLIYSNYRSLFEQRPIEYLLYRLDALVSQSIKCVGSHKNEMDEEQIEDLVEYLKMSYNDLLETVQALREVVNTMDDLSKSLYSQWGLIKDARKRQGYQTTNALLTSKHLVSNIRKGSTSFDPKKSRRKVVSTATTETGKKLLHLTKVVI